MVKEKPDKTKEVLTCQHCGFKGAGVTRKLGYVGGQGYVLRNYCVDIPACSRRHDKGASNGVC